MRPPFWQLFSKALPLLSPKLLNHLIQHYFTPSVTHAFPYPRPIILEKMKHYPAKYGEKSRFPALSPKPCSYRPIHGHLRLFLPGAKAVCCADLGSILIDNVRLGGLASMPLEMSSQRRAHLGLAIIDVAFYAGPRQTQILFLLPRSRS